MRIALTIWERVQLAAVVGSGSAPTIAAVDLGLKALAVLNLSDEEKAEAGFVVMGPGQFGWSRNRESREYELELDDDVWQIIQAFTRAFQSWPIDKRSRPLYEKVVGEGGSALG